MSAAQAAELNIDLRTTLPTLEDDYDRISRPVEFVIGSKRHMGATDEECRTMRAAVTPLVSAHANVSLFATLPVSHTQILAKHPDTVAAAIDQIAKRAGDGLAGFTPGPATTFADDQVGSTEPPSTGLRDPSLRP